MIVLCIDVHHEVDHQIVGHGVGCFNYSEVLYADDTLVVGNRAREVNIILAAIERESAKYNLKLNKRKCVVVNMNCNANVHFEDGTPVPSKTLRSISVASLQPMHPERQRSSSEWEKRYKHATNSKCLEQNQL